MLFTENSVKPKEDILFMKNTVKPKETNCLSWKAKETLGKSQLFPQHIVESLLNSQQRVNDRPSWILILRTPARKPTIIVVFFPNKKNNKKNKKKTMAHGPTRRNT